MKLSQNLRKISLLNDRELSHPQVMQLRKLFKMMANDTRLRILQALIQSSELCVNELANTIGMKPQAISNQLQRMADQGILGSRREGNSIYYSIIDPCVPEIMDRAYCLIEMSKKTVRVKRQSKSL